MSRVTFSRLGGLVETKTSILRFESQHEYGRRPLLWLIIKYVPCVPLCHVINLMWSCGYIFQCMTYVMVDIKDLLLYIFSFSFLPNFFHFHFIFVFFKIITSTTLTPPPPPPLTHTHPCHFSVLFS